jgi:hypothetical protein
MVIRFALSVFAIKAATVAEALEKIPCEHVKKEGDGLWSAADAIEIPNERSEHPKISDPKQTAILERRCPPKPGCKGTRMNMTGVGC